MSYAKYIGGRGPGVHLTPSSIRLRWTILHFNQHVDSIHHFFITNSVKIQHAIITNVIAQVDWESRWIIVQSPQHHPGKEAWVLAAIWIHLVSGCFYKFPVAAIYKEMFNSMKAEFNRLTYEALRLLNERSWRLNLKQYMTGTYFTSGQSACHLVALCRVEWRGAF